MICDKTRRKNKRIGFQEGGETSKRLVWFGEDRARWKRKSYVKPNNEDNGISENQKKTMLCILQHYIRILKNAHS